VPAILPISLALNAILIAFAVSDATAPSQSTLPPPAFNANAPAGAKEKAGAPPRSTRKPARGEKSSAAPTRSVHKRDTHSARPVRPRNPALERKLLNLIVQAPAGKLPRALINSKTGLAKNNLQAVCRRETGSRSFLCIVQPAQHKPGEGLYVRYRLNRKGTGGTFIWSRYRT
jgi:hypothetical protein